MTQADIARKIAGLMQKYRSQGVLMGGTVLLLPPYIALNLIDDLTSLGVATWGVECWYYGDSVNKQKITENVGRDFTTPDDIMKSDDAAKRSAELVKDFILHQLPHETALVSLTLEIAYNRIYFD